MPVFCDFSEVNKITKLKATSINPLFTTGEKLCSIYPDAVMFTCNAMTVKSQIVLKTFRSDR